MGDEIVDTSEHEQRVNRLLAEYLEAERLGQAPDRDELLRRHPELARELQSFFADKDQFGQLAGLLAVATPKPADTATTTPESSSEAAAATKVRYVGDYELLEEIARGGMGVVYKARQISLQRLVALKMILAGQFASADEVRRFRTEAENAARLDHPHIVPIYGVGEHEGQHFFSMKLIEGSSLDRQLASFTADPRATARLMALVARAVHHAHQRGVLHRDLKPGNILLDPQGQPHVTDFGLAKRVTGDGRLTQSGAIVGTPSYMAPEQARAEKGLSTAADVYSLGAILYELLTGQPPFRAATPLDTLLQVLERETQRPHALKPGVDRDLETVCLKCLDKDPARRYRSAEELAADLERFLGGEPISARRVGQGERLWRWCRRNPWVSGLAATLAVVFLVSFVAVTAWWRKAVANEKQAIYEGQEKLRAQTELAAKERKLVEAAHLEQTVRTTLASTFVALNNYHRAEAEVRKVLAANPKNYQARYLLCQIDVLQARYTRAVQHLEELVADPELPPENAKAIRLQLAGLHLTLLGEPKKGQDELRRVLADYPDDLETRLRLAELLVVQGRLVEAADQLKKVVATEEAPAVLRQNARLRLVNLYMIANQPELAEAELRRLPSKALALVAPTTLANLYVQQRRFAKAEKQFRDVLAGPRLPVGLEQGARLDLVLLYLETGANSKAEAELARLPDAAEMTLGEQSQLAYANALRGRNLPEAEATLRKLVTTYPSLLVYQARLGLALAKQGRTQEALALVEKLSADEVLARDPVYFDQLGDTYLQAGRPDDARTAWERALRRFPKTTGPDDHRKTEIEKKLKGVP
jgi:tetratricopeptide (TPR) repeat protein